MTLLNQADWYDDPNDSAAQRYWDGANWTPHRRRRPVQQAAPSRQPPPSPPQLPPPMATPPPPPMNSPPPPADVTAAIQLPPPNQLPSRRRRKLVLAIAAATVVLVAAVAGGLIAYRYFFAQPSTSAEQQPSASAQQQFAHDVASAGVMSADPALKAAMNLPAGPESTARIVAVATAVCADLNSGASKDAEAMQVYQGALAGTPAGGAPLPHDKAVKIVDLAIEDVCPGK